MRAEPTMRDQLRALSDHYSAYLGVIDTVPIVGPFADYGWGNLPDRLSGVWLVYGQMFDEFARELPNTINQLVSKEQRLGAWEIVVADLDPDAFNNVLYEFIEPVATIALNLPVVIRDRIVFATAHLIHQANQALGFADWRDDLPTDREVKRRDLEKRGHRWSAMPELLDTLDRLAAQADYDAQTGNFRNRYHHRFSPRIGIGITGLVTRIVEPQTKKISYAIGGAEPLSLAQIRAFLGQQIAHAHEAYGAFKALVREFENAIVHWESEHSYASGASPTPAPEAN
jgi:hypothetical protein